MSIHPSLAGRVVVVTGGSRGLGREMALELAGHGALLVITGAAETPELAATAEEIGAHRALALAADVCDPAAAEGVVAAAEARFGRVDVLVNNAGRGMRLVSETFNSQPTKFWEVSPVAWKTIVDSNVNGAFNMARAATPRMISRGFGRIVNISTSDITMVRRGYSPYGPSKAALEAASRVWADDLAATGVTVNVYLPGGAADTDLLPPGPGKKGADGNLLPAAIMRRAICWLASDASSAVTGARFIARNWDPALPDDEAAAAARIAGVDRPAIM